MQAAEPRGGAQYVDSDPYSSLDVCRLRNPLPDRRPIKQAHEKAYIEAFLRWHAVAYRSRFCIVARPDPPDAIIRSERTTRWVEVGDAYWSDEWARDLNSYATPGEKHCPIHGGPHVGMDEQHASRFVAVLKDKLESNSYASCNSDYGPGYLVLPMMSPFFDANTTRLMRQYWDATSALNLGFFRGVFLAYRSLNQIQFRRWKLRH
jgi:hypothetical protein